MSPRVQRVAHALGLLLDPDRDADRASALADAAAELDRRLPRAGVALAIGPSGAGKSTLLRALAGCAGAGRAVVTVAPPSSLAREPRAPVELMGRTPVGDALRLLGTAGLADAAAMVRPARRLSEGQRARVALAIAMAAAERRARALPATAGAPVTVLADEFASTLDRAGAWCLARTAARWARRHDAARGVRLVCATAHDDLAGALRPDLLVRVDDSGEPAITTSNTFSSGDEETAHPVRIRPGTRAEAAALVRFHYRRTMPATCAMVLCAEARATGELAGALVVSMPTLNSPLRELAWPGRYRTGDPRADAARLNAEVRTISRLIVRPPWRGAGVGTMLTRAYLRDPLTPATEAVAAMGAASPVLRSAGMTPHRLPVRKRDARLVRALANIGLRPHQLCDASAVLRTLRARGDAAASHIERELRIWADASSATRRDAHGADIRKLLAVAAQARVGLEGWGYTHTAA